MVLTQDDTRMEESGRGEEKICVGAYERARLTKPEELRSC